MFTDFNEVIAYLNNVARKITKVHSGGLGLDRTYALLSLLDNPQKDLQVIHITGTSGKGSTAYLTASALASQGYSVGLTVSPHILDIRERVQINNQLIDKNEFVSYINTIKPFIDMIAETSHGHPTYFEILICLSFYIFKEKQVDFAVVEVGIEGEFDSTNVLTNKDKILIINTIGLDHEAILGNTMREIATQVSSSITPHSTVFTLNHATEIATILDTKAKASDTHIQYVMPLDSDSNNNIIIEGTHYPFSLIGIYQVSNTSLALAAVKYVMQRQNKNINIPALMSVWSTLTIPGRFDIISLGNSKLVIDGAHNPQKMEAFVNALDTHYAGKEITFLLAFKDGKNIPAMIDCIFTCAKHITITSIMLTDFRLSQDFPHFSSDNTLIKNYIKTKYRFESVSIKQSHDIISNLRASQRSEIVGATGSLYLASSLYEILKNN